METEMEIVRPYKSEDCRTSVAVHTWTTDNWNSFPKIWWSQRSRLFSFSFLSCLNPISLIISRETVLKISLTRHHGGWPPGTGVSCPRYREGCSVYWSFITERYLCLFKKLKEGWDLIHVRSLVPEKHHLILCTLFWISTWWQNE